MTTLYSILGVVGVARALHRKPLRGASNAGTPLLPITILKPLRGVDDEIERNLTTFYEQDHPCFEVVFGVEGEDAALEIARRVASRFPEVPTHFAIHEGGHALNPKVRNLLAMWPHAHHDVVVISDSNVHVQRDYLSTLAQEIAEPGVGLVTNLVVGSHARTLGGVFEATQLNGATALGVGVGALVGTPVAVGKSMVFRRSALARLGGLESLSFVLAEDYVLGRIFHEAGYEVRLSRSLITTSCARLRIRDFIARHLRWAVMRGRLLPLTAALEPLTSPNVIVAAAALAGIGTPALFLWAGIVTGAREIALTLLLRPAGGFYATLVAGALAQVRDLLLFVVWCISPFVREVAWRGRRVRISAGTRLYARPQL